MKRIYEWLASYFCGKAGLVLDSTVAFKANWELCAIRIKDGKIKLIDGPIPHPLTNLTIWNRFLSNEEIKEFWIKW